jgi:alpha-tubulin suppressor-like RCC1 family protein
MSMKSALALGATLLFMLAVAPGVASAVAPAGVPFDTGYNGYDELGRGSTASELFSTAPVPGLTSVVAASTDYYQTLVALPNGSVEAWGYNYYGELGDGTKTERNSPELIGGLANVTSVAAGYYHSLALTSEGTVYAWGYNGYGELGNGAANPESLVPEQVKGVSEAVQIAAGCYDSFAVLKNGEVDAWGYNGTGELGDGTKTERTSPERIPGLTEVKAISASCYHTLALLQNGTVEAFGENVEGDVNGSATKSDVETPTPVGLSGVKAISAGYDFNTALLEDGTVDAWGEYEYGELGDGTEGVQLKPHQVPGLSNVAAISSGIYSTVALLNNGSVEGFGYDGYGELGSGLAPESESATTLSYPAAGIGLATDGGYNYMSLVIEGAAGSVSGTSLAFGNQVIGTKSAAQSIVVTNKGPAPMSVSGDALSGAGVGAFAKTADSCQGATLANGATCTISYSFAPSAVGADNASLAISSNGVGGLPAVALSATATPHVPPVLGSLLLTSSAFAAAHSGASAVNASASGTYIIYTDSQIATTTFTLQQKLTGVYKGSGKSKACGKAPKHPKHHAKRCTYMKTLGSFTHADAVGTNALRFTGRVAGHTLAHGSYRLSAVAASAEGSSGVKTATFTITR